MSEKHETPEEAIEAVLNELRTAAANDRWMIAVFTCDNDGIVTIRKVTTWQFPHAAMWTAMSLLAKKFSEFIYPKVEEPEPLESVNVEELMGEVFTPNRD